MYENTDRQAETNPYFIKKSLKNITGQFGYTEVSLHKSTYIMNLLIKNCHAGGTSVSITLIFPKTGNLTLYLFLANC